jgi:hypothetical protein
MFFTRLLPGGRKKLTTGLAAQNIHLLFQPVTDFTELGKTYDKI